MEESRDETRREFLSGVKRWSGAVVAVAVAGRLLVDSAPAAAGAWVNRGGGGWVNRYGGGGWINGGGSGGWVNRYGGAGWINGGGSGGWVNRRGGGGAWVNR